MRLCLYHGRVVGRYLSNYLFGIFSFTLSAAAFPDSSLLSLLQIQDDLRVHVAEPRPAVGRGGGEAAPAGLRVRPRCGLRQDQGLHPYAAHALQPGGAAGGNGPEDRPLPPEGESLTSWEILHLEDEP